MRDEPFASDSTVNTNCAQPVHLLTELPVRACQFSQGPHKGPGD